VYKRQTILRPILKNWDKNLGSGLNRFAKTTAKN